MDFPFITDAVNPGHRAETDDLCAHVTRPLGQGLGQLRGVDITIQRVPLATMQVMGFKERVDILHIRVGHFLKIDAHLPAHGLNMAEFLHALATMGQADRPGDVIVHGVVDFITKTAVQLGRIGLDFNHGP